MLHENILSRFNASSIFLLFDGRWLFLSLNVRLNETFVVDYLPVFEAFSAWIICEENRFLLSGLRRKYGPVAQSTIFLIGWSNILNKLIGQSMTSFVEFNVRNVYWASIAAYVTVFAAWRQKSLATHLLLFSVYRSYIFSSHSNLRIPGPSKMLVNFWFTIYSEGNFWHGVRIRLHLILLSLAFSAVSWIYVHADTRLLNLCHVLLKRWQDIFTILQMHSNY